MIPDEDYEKILDLMPICCIDVIVVKKGKYLLVKRNNEPAKKQWWIPGGRVNKYEELVDAIKREVHEETGLRCQTIQQVGTITFLIDDIHTISTIFNITPTGTKVQLNYEHSSYQWVDNLPKTCHPKLREIVKMVTHSALAHKK